MRLWLAAYLIGALEFVMLSRLIGGGDFEEFLSRASLSDFIRARAHVTMGTFMWNLAGILYFIKDK